MSEARRQYLAAMGIQAWVRRDELPASQKVTTDVRQTAVSADVPVPALTSKPSLPGDAVNTRPAAPEVREISPVESTPVSMLGWEELEAQVRECARCELHRGRTHAVFGVGARDAQWMIIGEGPGAEEDRQGEPFVGRAGKLLNNMLRSLGLRREAVYIANIVKCRPPNNRDPKPEEASACRPYLERQIELVRPSMILAVGRIAAQNLLDTDAAVGKLRGRIHRYGETRIPLVVTYHPAYLLRSPEQKARAWEDLCLARASLEGGDA